MDKKSEIDDLLKKKIIENKPGGGPKRVIKNVKILDPSKISLDVKKKIAEALTKHNATSSAQKTASTQEANVSTGGVQPQLIVKEKTPTDIITKRKSNEIKVLSVEKVDTPSLVEKLTNIPKCYVTDIIPGTKNTEIKLKIPSTSKISSLQTRETNNNNTTLPKAQISIIHKNSSTQQMLNAKERSEKVSVINIPPPKDQKSLIYNNLQPQEVLTPERNVPAPPARGAIIRNVQLGRTVTTQKGEKVIIVDMPVSKPQTAVIQSNMSAQEMPAQKIKDSTTVPKAPRGRPPKKTHEVDVKSILNAKIKQKNTRKNKDVKADQKDQTFKREEGSINRLNEHQNAPSSNIFIRHDYNKVPKELNEPFKGFTPEEIKIENEKLELLTRSLIDRQAGKIISNVDSNLFNESKPNYKTKVNSKSFNALQPLDTEISHSEKLAVSQNCNVIKATASSDSRLIDDLKSERNIRPKTDRDSLRIPENVPKTLDTLPSMDMQISHGYPFEETEEISQPTGRSRKKSYKNIPPELRNIVSLNKAFKKYEKSQSETPVKNLFDAANVKCDLSLVKVENAPRVESESYISSHWTQSLERDSTIKEHRNTDSGKSSVKVGDIIDMSSAEILSNYNKNLPCIVIPPAKNTESDSTTKQESIVKSIRTCTVSNQSRTKDVQLAKQENKRVEPTSRNLNVEKLKVEDNKSSKPTSSQSSSNEKNRTDSTNNKESIEKQAKELSEKVCQLSNITFSDDVVKVVKFLYPYIDVRTLDMELSKKNQTLVSKKNQTPVVKEEFQNAVDFLLNCKALNEIDDDDEDYDYSYMDLLSDEDVAKDKNVVQPVQNTADTATKKEPENSSRLGSKDRPRFESVAKVETSTIPKACQHLEGSIKPVEQEQALDLSKTSKSNFSPQVKESNNLSFQISGYNVKPKASSSSSSVAGSSKSDDLKLTPSKPCMTVLRPGAKPITQQKQIRPIVESKDVVGTNTVLQSKDTSVDLTRQDSQNLPEDLSDDDCLEYLDDNVSMTHSKDLNVDKSISADYESEVLQQVSKDILVDVLSEQDSITREGKYHLTMLSEQIIQRMATLEQGEFAMDIESIQPKNVPNDVRVEILSMEGSKDREYLHEDMIMPEQREVSTDIPSVVVEERTDEASIKAVVPESSTNKENEKQLLTHSEALDENDHRSEHKDNSVSLVSQQTENLREQGSVETQSEEKNKVIFELDVNYNENEEKQIPTDKNLATISEEKSSNVIKKEREMAPKPYKFIPNTSSLKELKNALILGSSLDSLHTAKSKTETEGDPAVKTSDEMLQKEDSTDNKQSTTNSQGIKKPFKSRKAKVNLAVAKRRNVQSGKKQTSNQSSSFESKGPKLEIEQINDNEDEAQRSNVSASSENRIGSQYNRTIESRDDAQIDVHISVESKVPELEESLPRDAREVTDKEKSKAEQDVPSDSSNADKTKIESHTNSSDEIQEISSRSESLQDSNKGRPYETPLLSDKIKSLVEEDKNAGNEIPSPQYEHISPNLSQTLDPVESINETASLQKPEENSSRAETSNLSDNNVGITEEEESKKENKNIIQSDNALKSKPEDPDQVQYGVLECTVVDEEVFEVTVNNDSSHEESRISPVPSDHSSGEYVDVIGDSEDEALETREEENTEELQAIANCSDVKENTDLGARLDGERKTGVTSSQNEEASNMRMEEMNVERKPEVVPSSSMIFENDRNVKFKVIESFVANVEAKEGIKNSTDSILKSTDSSLQNSSSPKEVLLEVNVEIEDDKDCPTEDMSVNDKKAPAESSASPTTTHVIPNKTVEEIHQQTKPDKDSRIDSACESDLNALVKSTDSSSKNKSSDSNKTLKLDEQEENINESPDDSSTKIDIKDSLKSRDLSTKTEVHAKTTDVLVKNSQDCRNDDKSKCERNVSSISNITADRKTPEKAGVQTTQKDGRWIESIFERDKKVTSKFKEVNSDEKTIGTKLLGSESDKLQTESDRNVSEACNDPPVKKKRGRKKAVPNIDVEEKHDKKDHADSLCETNKKLSGKCSLKNKLIADKKTLTSNKQDKSTRDDSISETSKKKSGKRKLIDAKVPSEGKISNESKSVDTSPSQKRQITNYFKVDKSSPSTAEKEITAPMESPSTTMTEKQFESALNLKRRHSKSDPAADISNVSKKLRLFDDCWAENFDVKPDVEKFSNTFSSKEIGMHSTPMRSIETKKKSIEPERRKELSSRTARSSETPEKNSESRKDLSLRTARSSESPEKNSDSDNINESDDLHGYEDKQSDTVYFLPNEKFEYDELHPNILLVDKAENLNKPIVDQNLPIPKGSVKCGACKEIVVRKKIDAHYATHYFVGWIDGDDDPVNLHSYRDVVNKMMKMSKKKTKALTCRICSAEKKSALGMISHLLDCAKADKIFACKLCKMKVKRASIYAHTAYCRKLRNDIETKAKEKKRKADTGNTEVTEHSVTGRVKRRSVIKAEKKFKEISGNTFETDWYIAQFKKKIVSVCDENGKTKVSFSIGFKCTLCNDFTSTNQEDVSNHISDVHKKEMCPPQVSDHSEDEAVLKTESSSESELSAEEEEPLDNEKKKKRKKPKSKTQTEKDDTNLSVINCENQILYNKILANTQHAERAIGILDFSQYKAFAKKFRDLNYFDHYILPECKPNSKELTSDAWEEYKPNNVLSIKYYYKTISKPSLQYGTSSVPEKWSQLQTLEIERRQDEELLYLGGPINFLQWVPLPDDYPKNAPQFLVVAVKQRYNHFMKVKNSKIRKSLIQIWEISYKEASSRLHYSIAVENGPIINMAFLPSGGYAPSLNRLALIVISLVNAEILLLPLPLKAPQNCDNSKNNISPLIEVNPFAYLKLDVRTNYENRTHKEAECTQLCWSESKGHNFIFAGFTNGFVAIWDIDQEDNLNKFSLNGASAFIPIAYFSAVTTAVTSLQVHYDENGPRWLLITSESRDCKFYDLCDINLPVSINNDDFLRSKCSASCWPYYWPNPSLLITDEFIASPPHILQKTPSGVVYRFRNNLPVSSNLNDISFSCWYNTLLVGTDNGDIYLRKQYNPIFDPTANRWKRGRFVGCTEIMRLDGSRMPKLSQSKNDKEHLAHEIRKIFDRDYMNKYGIVFTSMVDAPINPYDKLTLISRNPPHTLRDFVRVSKVSINNNYVAKKLYAVGYENGFVRIRSLDEFYK